MRPNLVLRLTGDVKTLAVLDPNYAAFGVIPEGSGPIQRRVKITAGTDAPLRLSLPEGGPSRRMKYALETKVPEREYELVVTAEPPFAPGPISDVLNLETGDPRQRTVDIRSGGTVVPRLAIEPAFLQMAELAPGRPFKGSVRVVNRGERPVKVLGASSEAPEVRLTVHEVTPGASYEVQVDAPQDYAPPEGGLPVRVATDDPEAGTLTFNLLPKPRRYTTPAQLVGRAAPAFSVRTADGKEVSNATLQKEVTLLDFIYADDPTSRHQIPVVAKVVREFADRPVRLVLVVQKLRSEFGKEEVAEALRRMGQGLESTEFVLDMKNELSDPFLVSQLPALVVLGRDGRVRAADLAFPADLEARVRRHIEESFGGGTAAPAGASAER